MFFILSKTVTVLLMPSSLILLAGLVGMALMATARRRAGIRLMVTSIVLLLIGGLSPLGAIMTHVLEARFPQWEKTGGPSHGAPTGIIVLGGGISSGLSRQTGTGVVSAYGGR